MEHQYEYPVQYEVGEAPDLTKLSREDLEAIRNQASQMLKELDRADEAKAAAEIRKIGKKHGWNISIDRRKRPQTKGRKS